MSTVIAANQGATTEATRSQRTRAWDRTSLVFALATAVGLLHGVDDAILNRQPGVPITQHLWALLTVAVVAVPAVLLFPRMRTGLRAVTALVFGAVTLVNGALHAIHVAADEVSGSDVTGLLAAVAGVVLIVVAALLPFHHRGERALPPVRRWAVRVSATATTGALVFLVVLPIGVGIGKTHLFRSPIGAPPGGSYREVTFRSSDGLRLAGWYIRSRNGAAVVVASSAGGDRLSSVEHAQLLADHGYGVLLYDARGSGESEGSPNGFGWDWHYDVAGALAFLRAQPGVDPQRLGGLGLSTGADVLIEYAASHPDLRAVVADGATGRSLADIQGNPGTAVQMAPVLATASVLSGTRPGPPLEDLVAAVAPTPLLLIAAGSIPGEIAMNEVYARAAKPPVDFWVLPDARHTAAIRDEAVAYERRVIGHFDNALLPAASDDPGRH